MKKRILLGSVILSVVSVSAYANENYEIIPPPSYEKEKAKMIAEEKALKEARIKAEEKALKEARVIAEEKAMKRLAEKENERTSLLNQREETKDTNLVIKNKKEDNYSPEISNDAQTKNVEYKPTNSLKRVPYFSAEKNEMLSVVLERWAKQEGWTLHWSYPNDFRLPAGINTTGKIEDVFKKVGESLISEKIDLSIQLYRLNQVIVIK